MAVKLVKELTIDEAKKLKNNKEYNFRYICGWSGFDAFGSYYIDAERKLCLFIHFNERAGTDLSALHQYDDLAELANWIWEEEKGTVPFKEIREGIKRVSGVDVLMNSKNRIMQLMFGEADK